MMDYSTSSVTRNTAVVNAVSLGAVGVILVHTRSNRAPPSAFTLTTPQPDVPVVGGGTAHGDWIKALIAEGPLTLRIATFSYTNPQGTNVVAVRHAVNDPDGTTAPVIMVGGHIDGVLGSPAAHDNGTGPSTAVEIGRVLSRVCARQRDPDRRLRRRGDRHVRLQGLRRLPEPGGSRPVRRRVGSGHGRDAVRTGRVLDADAGRHVELRGSVGLRCRRAHRASRTCGNCRLGQSDHQSFFDAGIPASLFIWIDYRPTSTAAPGVAHTSPSRSTTGRPIRCATSARSGWRSA